MSADVNDVTFEKAKAILEITEEQLEQLLDDGILRGYRSGNDIVFKRQDLADYITGGRAGAAPPPPPVTPTPENISRSKASTKDIKSQAMGNGNQDMWSMRKVAIEDGQSLDLDHDNAPKFAGGAALLEENKSLRGRLHAAEEVLHSLQGRIDEMNTLSAKNTELINEVTRMRSVQVELEAKLSVFEEMEQSSVEGPRWGAPDPSEEIEDFKKKIAELTGQVASARHTATEAEARMGSIQAERDQLNQKLTEATTNSAGGIEQLASLEAELEDIRNERDMMAVELEVARELKGEIDRAAELEDNLETQRELIIAAQEGMAELEVEKTTLENSLRELEATNSSLVTQVEELGQAAEHGAEQDKRVAQLDARMSLLRDERDNLTQEIGNRDRELAELKTNFERVSTDATELTATREKLSEVSTSLEETENALAQLRVQMSLKEQLLDQLKKEGDTQDTMAAEVTELRGQLAESENRAKMAEARIDGLREERDSLTSALETATVDASELKLKAGIADSLKEENKELKGRIEDITSSAAGSEVETTNLKNKITQLETNLAESNKETFALRKELEDSKREIEKLNSTSGAESPETSEALRVRAELESLRKTITEQMTELGTTRERARSKPRPSRRTTTRTRLTPSTRRRAAAPKPEKPDQLGRYKIIDTIRKTRGGTYYKSEVQPSGGEVMVLVLPPELTRDRAFLDRFWHEMRIIAELDHPKLLGIMDIGETGGYHYISYESSTAETLEALLKREPKLEPALAISIATSILDALSLISKNKLTHGDIKPANVLIDAEGGVKLAGLGMRRGSELDASAINDRGRIVHYGAPEQIKGADGDITSDIWAVGALLFQMLSGHPPIEAASPSEAIALIEAGELPVANDVDGIDANLTAALEKLIAENPASRFQSAEEAKDALSTATN